MIFTFQLVSAVAVYKGIINVENPIGSLPGYSNLTLGLFHVFIVLLSNPGT